MALILIAPGLHSLGGVLQKGAQAEPIKFAGEISITREAHGVQIHGRILAVKDQFPQIDFHCKLATSASVGFHPLHASFGNRNWEGIVNTLGHDADLALRCDDLDAFLSARLIETDANTLSASGVTLIGREPASFTLKVAQSGGGRETVSAAMPAPGKGPALKVA